MLRRIACSLTVFALFASACSGRAEVYEVPPNEEAAERGATLPDPTPATPVFVLKTDRPLDRVVLRKLRSTSGVAVLAPISTRKLKVQGPKGRARLVVGAVDPLEFRSVAPPSTREAEFIWVSLVLGQAVPSFDAADRLGLSDAGAIEIAGIPGIQVGAVADNGSPNLVDVLVQNGERRLPLGRPTMAIVGARSGVTIQKLGADLRQRARGIKLQRLSFEATAPAPQKRSQGETDPVYYFSGGVIGTMRFQLLENGFIRPDPSWVAQNIVTAQIPVLGSVRCHRLMIPRLQAVFTEIEKRGFAHLIRRGEYGGCFVPRFIDRNPKKSLSFHAFGLAIDFNVSSNRLGTRGDMDPRIVRLFEAAGFTWGGRWSRSDPMHFELNS
jgi:hypothetical protein